ncbi:MAG: hypothetical protein GDA46_02025 [Bdellovibrionales bacterium]|nr:hypothetical protein [Bdellovibrionales bacterium]
MSYFSKLSEDERLQELAYDELRRKIDYRLDGIRHRTRETRRQTSRKKGTGF